MQEAVRVGTADVAIGAAPVDWSGPQRRVGWNEVVVVLPARDPLGGRPGGIKLEQLADRHWVLYEAAYGLSDVVTAACLNAGFRPNGAIETSQAEAAARLAAAGLGPALVPVANLPPELAGFARRLSPPVVWEIIAYTRTAWSATALAFPGHRRGGEPGRASRRRDAVAGASRLTRGGESASRRALENLGRPFQRRLGHLGADALEPRAARRVETHARGGAGARRRRIERITR